MQININKSYKSYNKIDYYKIYKKIFDYNKTLLKNKHYKNENIFLNNSLNLNNRYNYTNNFKGYQKESLLKTIYGEIRKNINIKNLMDKITHKKFGDDLQKFSFRENLIFRKDILNREIRQILIKNNFAKEKFKEYFINHSIYKKKEKRLDKYFAYNKIEKSVEKSIKSESTFEREKITEYKKIKKELREFKEFKDKIIIREKNNKIDFEQIYEKIKEKIFEEVFMMSGGMY